jgi:hypothetical protein
MNENGKGDLVANHYPYFTQESGKVEVLRVLRETVPSALWSRKIAA